MEYEFDKEAMNRVMEIDQQLREENSKEVADRSKITKLMFEQMLRGLSLNCQGQQY